MAGNLGIDIPPGTLNSVLKRGRSDELPLVVINRVRLSWGAYVPDSPVLRGRRSDTRDQVLGRSGRPSRSTSRCLAEEGGAIPLPVSEATVIAVKAA